MNRAVRDEADLQAPQSQAGQQARIPREDEEPRWSRRVVPSSPEGPRTADGGGGQEVATSGKEPGEGLPRDARIRRTREIRELLERGKRKRTTNVEVFLAPSPASFSRLGVVVAKHGRRIVDRNLLKRRLREIGRRHVLPEMCARGAVVDVLIRARGKAYEADFGELARDVLGAVEELWSQSS
jgi:ribonuclease P protein component